MIKNILLTGDYDRMYIKYILFNHNYSYKSPLNMNISQFMNYLIDRKIKDLPASALAEVFDLLIWCLDDNGSEILQERESWLSSEDKYKVEIALSMEEVFPYKNDLEMNESFHSIADKWPDLADRCNELIRKRKQIL